MRILFLTQFLPYYPNTGGKIKTWEVFKLLAKFNQIDLVTFVDNKHDLTGIKKVRPYCNQVKVIENPIITHAHKELKIKAILSLFSVKPFRVLKHYSEQMDKYIKRLLENNHYDFIYFDHDVMLQYLDIMGHSRAQIIYDEHNITSEGAWSNFLLETNLLSKFGYLLETIKWLIYERRYIPRCDKIFAISQRDKEQIIKLGVSKKSVIFLPVPIKIKKASPGRLGGLFFVGLMSWKPNEDGFWWFYKQIFPIVKRSFPKIKLTVVGAHPSRQILALSKTDGNIAIKGYVKNINRYFEKSSVFIIPIRNGSGIRIKLLKAMAHGIPVVSTTVGASGVSVKNQKEVLIADKPKEFARAIKRLLIDKRLANKLSANAQKYIQNNFSTTNARKKLMDFIT